MTKKALKDAVKKYSTAVADNTAEEMKDTLTIDGFSDEDADTIIAELYPAESAKDVWFEEWQVQIKGKGKFDKLNCTRPCVKISEEEAEVLNTGVLSGGNTYAKMYFRPE